MSWLFSTHACPVACRPCSDSCVSTRLARSVVSAQAAKRSLNSSSLVPAQLRASAKTPVTLPTCTVSLMLSAKLSMGIESP